MSRKWGSQRISATQASRNRIEQADRRMKPASGGTDLAGVALTAYDCTEEENELVGRMVARYARGAEDELLLRAVLGL